MNRRLFELALDKTRSSDWEYFEELSSGFLASEFAVLRTMASPSGDGGRDSELFSSDGATYVAVQYSVAKDFDPKVVKTINRIEENFDQIRVLIYCTNQQIGAKGDALKKKCIGKGISLDIRDKNWFLERYELDDNKYSCAFGGINTQEIDAPYCKTMRENKPISVYSEDWVNYGTDRIMIYQSNYKTFEYDVLNEYDYTCLNVEKNKPFYIPMLFNTSLSYTDLLGWVELEILEENTIHLISAAIQD